MTTKSTKTVSKRASSAKTETSATETKKTTTPVSSKKTSKKQEPVVQPEPVQEDVEVEVAEPKQRRQPTRETYETDGDSLVESIRGEIDAIRGSDKKKGTGVKFLRAVSKRVKQLVADGLRISKQKQKSNRKSNTTSGFMKQVAVSKEMCKFANWDPAQQRSRVEVTKFICDYIKDHNLQNPEDRRQIVPDDKLSKLLNFDPKKSDKPLTYYTLQRVIQPHFPKTAQK